MTEPKWISEQLALGIHSEQLAEHGGPDGVRDQNMLGSALARPMNRFHYEHGSMPELAAAYAFGIARNHPFVDGNKRTAYVVFRTFLAINGIKFTAPREERYAKMLALAEGSMSEGDFAEWIRANCND